MATVRNLGWTAAFGRYVRSSGHYSPRHSMYAIYAYYIGVIGGVNIGIYIWHTWSVWVYLYKWIAVDFDIWYNHWLLLKRPTKCH